MTLHNSHLRYGYVAMLLHWAIAAMVLANIALALYFVSLPADDPVKSLFAQTHKSIGLTVLMLSLLRLAWRVMNPAPALPADMGRGARLAARGVHYFFYFLLIAIPLVGWSIVSVSPMGIKTIYFGLFQWPHIWFLTGLPMPERRLYTSYFVATHNSMAFAAAALILLHIGAALYHHVVRKDDVMKRMFPEAPDSRAID